MIDDTLRDIQRALRSYMDGVTARSLRAKGCTYAVVWGVALPHLRELAQTYAPDAALAAALWRCDVRECKLLATMLMPIAAVDETLARRWVAETTTEEVAELLVFNVLQHCAFAPALAAAWLTADAPIVRLSAYNLYARLFMQGYTPRAEAAEEFLTHAVDALTAEHAALRRAAMNSLVRYAERGEACAARARMLTQQRGFDFL